MEDLKPRIKEFLEEIEYEHLKKIWPEQLGAAGLDKREAQKWAAEIGHVIEEYQSSLMRLADLLLETDAQRIPREVHSWAVGTIVVTIPEIEDPMRYLKGEMEKYLPPEPEDEDEDA
jgi:hypothetical protein